MVLHFAQSCPAQAYWTKQLLKCKVFVATTSAHCVKWKYSVSVCNVILSYQLQPGTFSNAAMRRIASFDALYSVRLLITQRPIVWWD